MVIKHVYDCDGSLLEDEVQKVVNEVLLEKGCFMKLVDIKYSATMIEMYGIQYSALLIFS